MEHAWNTANQFIPALSIDLLDVNEFSRRLGRLVQNGSASLTIDPGTPFPWLTLKVAAKHKLPSGNKLKFELKFQIRVIWRQSDPPSLGFEPIPVSVEERDVENNAWEQGYARARDHFERGRITRDQFLFILGAIALAIFLFPVKVAAALFIGGLAAARTELQDEINEIFNSHGLESDINLGN